MDIDAYSATLTGAQLRRREEASPAFFENRKKCPDFGKKGPDFAHHWVKFSILNVVLRGPRKKTSKMFPCGASFSCVFDEMFIEVPKFHNLLLSCPEKILLA